MTACSPVPAHWMQLHLKPTDFIWGKCHSRPSCNFCKVWGTGTRHPPRQIMTRFQLTSFGRKLSTPELVICVLRTLGLCPTQTVFEDPTKDLPHQANWLETSDFSTWTSLHTPLCALWNLWNLGLSKKIFPVTVTDSVSQLITSHECSDQVACVPTSQRPFIRPTLARLVTYMVEEIQLMLKGLQKTLWLVLLRPLLSPYCLYLNGPL